ncbi:MAG: hypothetical protein J3K34DRAFT_30267 [Monoraphidium minutum]|nr:MAG: hypothetical protein J3K34DRAFT_30267 [Monoraphidium minutum]
MEALCLPSSMQQSFTTAGKAAALWPPTSAARAGRFVRAAHPNPCTRSLSAAPCPLCLLGGSCGAPGALALLPAASNAWPHRLAACSRRHPLHHRHCSDGSKCRARPRPNGSQLPSLRSGGNLGTGAAEAAARVLASHPPPPALAPPHCSSTEALQRGVGGAACRCRRRAHVWLVPAR